MEVFVEAEAYENVWDAIMDTPEEAAYMTMCSRLLIAIAQRIRDWDLSEAKTAERLGLDPERLSLLRTDGINAFTFEELTAIAVRSGLTLNLEIREAA
jgi:predicted XRE-type DNA-binding protein